MKHRTLRILSAMLFLWALVPVFTGCCPCAMAASEPHSSLVLQRNPCHGCCPEIKTGHLTPNFERAEPAGFQLSGRYACFYETEDAFDSDSPLLRFSRDAKAPPGSVPVYLSLKTLRI